MRVTVYNGRADGGFERDTSPIVGAAWEDVLETFTDTWHFEHGARYVLVAEDSEPWGDAVRIVTAREQARFALETS